MALRRESEHTGDRKVIVKAEPPQPACRITLDHALAMRLSGYAIALFYVAVGVIVSLGLLGGLPEASAGTVVLSGIAGLLVCVSTIVVHEAVHGVCMRMFGATPTYGVGRIGWFGFYAYASAPGAPFTLRQMVVICLAPLVVISVMALAVAWLVPVVAGFAALAFVTNVSGAAGDLWVVRQMWRFRRCRDLRFVDSLTSVEIHSSDPAAAAIASVVTSQRLGVVQQVILRWVIASSAILFGVLLLTVLLAFASLGDVVIGPRQFAIATYNVLPGGGVNVTLDMNAVIVVGLGFAVLSLLVVRPTKRDDEVGCSPGSPRPAFL